ncbi:MAG TPA: haloacid dehalogenase type II [Xanthobacteraceae bacterium]|jgi:2-haloacid dehalogenase|nr:haloacid dehalogenase type II [Xanthobacteraceae bacterium]
MTLSGSLPQWLTFDCYGTLIQWDEGLIEAVKAILARHQAADVNAKHFIDVYDRYEHELEQRPPHQLFREVAGESLRLALAEFGLASDTQDISLLTSGISRMPPFPEVVGALSALKQAGFKLCIISNTDDDIIAGNVAQLSGHIDRVITAQQAQAYKPSRRIFEHAHRALDVDKKDVVHICASPHLDHAAARDVGFRCVWVDRGTGRTLLPDYSPDATIPTLGQVPELFRSIGWI